MEFSPGRTRSVSWPVFRRLRLSLGIEDSLTEGRVFSNAVLASVDPLTFLADLLSINFLELVDFINLSIKLSFLSTTFINPSSFFNNYYLIGVFLIGFIWL
jgi:hypothetical protein